eukprot:NODE_43_length_28809_cov_0.237200.p20 type:complete len:117 gc:universal NODE_43_length_28809_cov_0.237200:1620-1270(-)
MKCLNVYLFITFKLSANTFLILVIHVVLASKFRGADVKLSVKAFLLGAIALLLFKASTLAGVFLAFLEGCFPSIVVELALTTFSVIFDSFLVFFGLLFVFSVKDTSSRCLLRPLLS